MGKKRPSSESDAKFDLEVLLSTYPSLTHTINRISSFLLSVSTLSVQPPVALLYKSVSPYLLFFLSRWAFFGGRFSFGLASSTPFRQPLGQHLKPNAKALHLKTEDFRVYPMDRALLAKNALSLCTQTQDKPIDSDIQGRKKHDSQRCDRTLHDLLCPESYLLSPDCGSFPCFILRR